MVQVLHVADLHIGVENYGQFDVVRGMHQRLIDFLDSLDTTVDYAIAQRVDLVLIAGDMFKNRSPMPRHQSEFAARIRRLHDHGIPVLMLVGNHDVAPGRDSANSVSVYEGLKYEGVTVARRLEVQRYTTTNGALAVIAVPWLMREIFVSNNDHLRMLGLADQEQEMERLVGEYIQKQVDVLMAEDAQRPIIVTYHGTVSGAVSGFERQLVLGRDIQLPQSVLCPQGVDYVALGHVHKHQVLRTTPPMVYAGSIDRIDFGEINETKGFVHVQFDGKETTYAFIPLQTRPFVEIEVDVKTAADVMDRIQTAIERKTLTNAIVKVAIDAEPTQRSQIHEPTIRKWLETAGVAYITRIIVTIPRIEARPTLRKFGDRLPTPAEALEIGRAHV